MGSETVAWQFTCTRTTGHPGGGTYSWPWGGDEAVKEYDQLGLGLDVELLAAAKTAIADAGTDWVEYGLVERAYALARPGDWALLLKTYNHAYYKTPETTRQTMPTTASARLGQALGAICRSGSLLYRRDKGTGRWNYNSDISYVALPAGAGDWDSRTTWAGSGLDMSYMPPTQPT